MTERARFVLEWERQSNEAGGRVNMAALCRTFGIKRQTGYKWLRRFLDGGRKVGALEDHSRRPDSCPFKTSKRVETAILRARAMHPRWGARKLRTWILQGGWKRLWINRADLPAASTIGAVLRRHGLTRPRRSSRKTPPYRLPFVSCDGPNATWCVDFKGWFRTTDGAICYPLTLMDGFSRKLLRCQVVAAQDHDSVRPVFESAFLEFGLPRAIRSDNGPPFATTGIGGLSKLSVWWTQLRIRHERISPGKPQENGRHERMHRTLKDETTNPPAHTLREQQRLFDRFVRSYNGERPHEALGGKTPDELYVRSARESPEATEPFEYPHDSDVRRVDACGWIKIRGARVRLSDPLARKHVAVRWLAARRWEVLFGHLTLGTVDLNAGSPGTPRIIGPGRKKAGRPPAVENTW